MVKQKGAGLLVAVLVVVVLIGGSLSFFGWKMTQQSVLGTEPATVTEVAEATAAGLKVGDAATVKTRTYDKESSANSQVATRLYIEEWNGDGIGNGDFQLIEDNTSTSATAATSTSTSIGSHLKICTFDSTYYGECQEVLVDKETKPISLSAFATVGADLKVQCYDDGAVLAACNITLGSGQSSALDYVRVEVNQSNKAFNFKMLAFDVATNSNLTYAKAEGAVTANGNTGTLTSTNLVPQRLRNTLDYLFVVDTPIMLHEWDVLKTSSVSFKAEAGIDPYEDATMYVIDEGLFKSVQSATANRILSGLEDDQDSANDVGTGDVTLAVGIN